MISAVARAFDPGCQADYVLVLEGAQRAGKSELFRALAPKVDWFLETDIDLGSKDSQQYIRSKWLVELSELDSLTRGEMSRIKGFITRRVDTYRKSYGRDVENVPRGCIFGGSVNPASSHQYLKDQTGNARWWVVWTPATQQNRLDTAKLLEVRDQLWAEAVRRYHDGERWHPTNLEVIQHAEREQEKRRVKHPWEELIADLLGANKRYQREGVSVAQILGELGIDAARATIADSMQIANSLDKCGWALGKTSRQGAKRVKLYFPKVRPALPLSIEKTRPR